MSGSSRRRGAATGFLPAVALLLLVGGLGATVAERRSDSVADAEAIDQMAGKYVSDVATFRAHTIVVLSRHRGAHPGELRDVVDRQLERFPALPSPAPAGAEHSASYRAAVEVSRSTGRTFAELRTQLDTADQAETFVKGAGQVMQRAKLALLSSSLVLDTQPLTSRTLPELRAARADVRRLGIPAKARPAAQAVDSTLSKAVREVETMVERLDAGGTYSYDLTDDFERAETQLRDYAVDVDGDVSEALARLRDS